MATVIHTQDNKGRKYDYIVEYFIGERIAKAAIFEKKIGQRPTISVWLRDIVGSVAEAAEVANEADEWIRENIQACNREVIA